MNKPLVVLQRAMSLFFEPGKEIPITRLIIFLYIASNEGRTTKEISQMINISTSSVSRCILSLSDTRTSAGPSTGLVYSERDIHGDRRNYFIKLTPAGKKLANKITNLMSM